MQPFEYAQPATLKDALGLLGARWGQAEVLAGGTDLLSLMKNYVATPKRLVAIAGISELRGIGAGAGGLRIGALVTLDELAAHAAVRRSFPSLVQAAEGVSSAQIRNLGTVGGDLCQRPRCWYFRNGFGLLARDAQGRALVPAGDNRYHAIFGHQNTAYFVHPSSMAPALVALGARVKIAGPNGQREAALAEFFRVPKSEAERENTLAPNEVLTEVLVPKEAEGLRNATYEVRQKEALDWPLAAASVALAVSGGRVQSARIVMGHVAPAPWPAREAEAWLAGKALNEETAAQAGEAAVRGAEPLSGNRYKVQLARVAVKRALLQARGE